MSHIPFNPLDKQNLARTVAKAMLEKPCAGLPRGQPFTGAGIYAIYYMGTFAAYEKIAALNRGGRFGAPIYVGKAVSKGARRGGFDLAEAAGSVLYNKLREHAESIQQAENLNLDDCACRYLVTDDIWIPLGEQLLIQTFSPLWNRVLDGFGNHDPGAGRTRQQRSPWDVIHPGRPWAKRLRPNKRSKAEILQAIRKFLAGWQPRQI